MGILRDLQSIELPREKLKDFKHVVDSQVVLLLIVLLLDGVLRLFGAEETSKIKEPIFFAVLGVYIWFLWDMLRNYTRSKTILIGLLVLIMGTFVIATIVINPFVSILSDELFRPVSALIMGTLLLVEIVVVVFTIRELFKRDLDVSERLWGAVCVYLVMAIAFGGMYELVCIADVNSMASGIPLSTSHFMESINFSLLMLGGLDIPYECSKLIWNIGAFESVWGSLFIVFVVGRMLYK